MVTWLSLNVAVIEEVFQILYFFPAIKEIKYQYSVAAPCRQQCLLYCQLILLTAKPCIPTNNISFNIIKPTNISEKHGRH